MAICNGNGDNPGHCSPLLGPVPFTLILAGSTSAGSTSPLKNQVVSRIRMPLGAVCLANMSGRNGVAPQSVLSMGDRLKMVDVDAGTIATQMVYIQALIHWPVLKNPHRSTCSDGSPVTHRYDSITRLGSTASKLNASVGHRLSAGQKVIRPRKRGSSHG